MLDVYEIRAKRVFTPTKIPGAKYVLNQYVGCEHACLYCYARFMCRWRNYGEWGSWIEIKENAPQLAREFTEGKVVMSSVSDPYQPIEKEFQLTRRVLENMDKRTQLSILTKSDLVTRDIDVFKEFEKLEVGLTLNGFEGETKRLFEPSSPGHKARLSALEFLGRSGVKTYGFISPVIPKLVNLESVVSESEGLVDYYVVELMNLTASGSKFRRVLRDKYPESYEILRNREKLEEFAREVEEVLRESNTRGTHLVTHYPSSRVINLSA